MHTHLVDGELLLRSPGPTLDPMEKQQLNTMRDNALENSENYNDLLKWIGLYDDPNSWIVNLGNDTNSWRWSATETTSRTGYHNWTAGQPNYSGGKDLCVKMQSDGAWIDARCNHHNYVACYTGKKHVEVLFS
uniref:C-type lectin domain-containing protein n=1 Tax=Salarias fasciatus TaxID=181472 RepID=A0A672FFT3_SALFA